MLAARPKLEAVGFDALDGYRDDDLPAAFRCFVRSAEALVSGVVSPRGALPPSAGLLDAARAALGEERSDHGSARRFFETWFRPYRVGSQGAQAGFLTGYYEPHVPASRDETPDFSWPLLSRPPDLVTFAPGEAPSSLPEGVTGARRCGDGSLVPYLDREAIERARAGPIAWVRDAVEAFLIQVQGSAQLRFPDGGRARLAYDGRNGLPYTSIGRILIETGAIPEPEMSLARLKRWLRESGLAEGEPGLALMRRNQSFVFFRLVETFDARLGPVAGEGVSLTPLRSIAVDRMLWPYGLPFWIEAELPWQSDTPSAFRRLMIAQDTGSAIVGGPRADLFFGGGDAGGARAGSIRHEARFVALLPLGDIR